MRGDGSLLRTGLGSLFLSPDQPHWGGGLPGISPAKTAGNVLLFWRIFSMSILVQWFSCCFGEGMYLSKLALTFHNLSVCWEGWWRGVACRNGEVMWVFKSWGLWDFVLMASYSSSSFWLLSVDSASSVNDPWEKLTIFLQLWNHGSCKLVFFSIWNAVIFFRLCEHSH